jgi:putative spermidine/putrescine transport system permease protein
MRALALPAGLLLALFFALPVGWIAVDAFSEGTLAFQRVIERPRFWQALGGSLILTAVAVSVSIAVGIAVALQLSRLPQRQRTLWSFVIALPLTFSGLIVAYGFILAYGRAGTVTQLLGLAGFDVATVGKALFTPTGLALASSYYLIPRVVMVLLPVFVNFDRALLDAAASLGATPAQAFRQVFLPRIRGAVIGAGCLVAAVVFGAYGTAVALVGTELDILPLQLYSLVSDSGSDFPAAAALALLITATCTSIIAVGEWAGRGRADGID